MRKLQKIANKLTEAARCHDIEKNFQFIKNEKGLHLIDVAKGFKRVLTIYRPFCDPTMRAVDPLPYLLLKLGSALLFSNNLTNKNLPDSDAKNNGEEPLGSNSFRFVPIDNRNLNILVF